MWWTILSKDTPSYIVICSIGQCLEHNLWPFTLHLLDELKGPSVRGVSMNVG